MMNLKPVRGERNKLVMIDQTLLPVEEKWLSLTTLSEVEDAIKRLAVRGAPAIGVAAAYGVCLHLEPSKTPEDLKIRFQQAYDGLKSTRPTAVNLFWALNRMKARFEALQKESLNPENLKARLFEEACAIEQEDYEMGRAIGKHGTSLMQGKKKITAMTICNAGGLATAGYGTALACFYMAKEMGIEIEVFALETRPLLQGSRLTAYELLKNGIKTTLLTDNMAGFLMKSKSIDLIITGADRIARNGDSANKIGTYQLSVLAKHHGIPFYVAAPVSTFDPSLKTGAEIPIEFRSKDEVIRFAGVQTAPLNVEVFSPAFDVAPAELITGIITNEGVYPPPYDFGFLEKK